MTAIVEKDSSGPDLGGDKPLSNGDLISYPCFPGGYSVWNCPPLEPNLLTPVQKADDVTPSAKSRAL